MNGFARSTNPPGLVVRLTHHVVDTHAAYTCEPRAASGPFRHRGDTLKFVLRNTSQLTSLLRIKRRGVAISRDVRAHIRTNAGNKLLSDYPLMLPILLPNDKQVLEAVADGVGAANEDKSLQMVPYLPDTLARAAAATSIQSAYRAYRCRVCMTPSLGEMVLGRRAAVCVQRYYANHTRKLRILMYSQAKAMLRVIGRTTRELEVTGAATKRLIQFMQEGPHQLFHEQQYMYGIDPYDQAFTCRLPAGRASAAARVDGALDRGLPKWIGTMVPHAPVETMADLDPDDVETFECGDIIPMLTSGVETVDAPPPETETDRAPCRSKPGNDNDDGGDGSPARLLQFATNDEARRRAALIFLFTWDPHARTGVTLIPATYGSFQAVVAEEAMTALTESRIDDAEERRKEKLKRFPPGSPMIPFVDVIHDPVAPLNRPSTRGPLTMTAEGDARDLHGTTSRRGRRQPRRSRSSGDSLSLDGGHQLSASQPISGGGGGWGQHTPGFSTQFHDGQGGAGGAPSDGGYSTGTEDRSTTAGTIAAGTTTMTIHPEDDEPLLLPRGTRRKDPRILLGVGPESWDVEADQYYAGGVGMLVNKTADLGLHHWGNLGMDLRFAPKAHSRAETWVNNGVKATMADIQRDETRAADMLVHERKLAEVSEKRAAIAATHLSAVRRPDANSNGGVSLDGRAGGCFSLDSARRRSANTSNMTPVTSGTCPREQREQREHMRQVQHEEAEAHVAAVKEEHRQSLERIKAREKASQDTLLKAGAIAKREVLQDAEAVWVAATRSNRWSVVVERHRNLRRAGRRDERVFAASFGRQQAALGKQIAAAELRHRGALIHGGTTAAAAAARAEGSERRASVLNKKSLHTERAREKKIVMAHDLDASKEMARTARQGEVGATRERVVRARDKRKALQKSGKRAPDRDVLEMTKVCSAT